MTNSELLAELELRDRLLMATIIRFTPGPEVGTVNIHDSILPDQGWDLVLGRDEENGYTTMKMVNGKMGKEADHG